MKILFSGGGTLGPVTPLLAIKDVLSVATPDARFLWIGTDSGPEKMLIEQEGIIFFAIRAGKLRRYASLLNIIDVANICLGTLQSLFFLIKHQPDICISAGGFVSVPVHFAAWIMGIPTWVHQQDVVPGLANKLMAPVASVITTALESSRAEFAFHKTQWIGNPVRSGIYQGSKEQAKKIFGLSGKLPVIFVTGGGTGSLRVNQMVAEAVHSLDGIAEIIHLTGKERPQEMSERMGREFSHYHPFQFLTADMKHAYAAADIVVSRGGFGTITELAALAKPTILIPKPGHQEANARLLSDAGAAIVLDEQLETGHSLVRHIRELLEQKNKAAELGKRLQQVMPVASHAVILDIARELARS